MIARIAAFRKCVASHRLAAPTIGRIVWNRQRFKKDPERGTRVSRANSNASRMTADAPQLAIVDLELWNRVQKRRACRAGPHGWTRRPKHLVSGLLKCGCCGSGYIVVKRDKRGSVVGCSRQRETGLSDNRRTLGIAAIEARVLEGIEQHLAAPELIAAYVRKFSAERARLAADTIGRRRSIERELDRCAADIGRLVNVLLRDAPSRALREALAEREAERERLEAELAALDAAKDPIAFHPRVAEHYRRKVADLKAHLAALDPEGREKACAAIRDLVEAIVITFRGRYQPADIEIRGKLAALLAKDGQQPGIAGSVMKVVAGVGFEPTTFRL